MTEKVVKKRYSVTLTKTYTDGLNELIERGLYPDGPSIIRSALRAKFEKHGIKAFQIIYPKRKNP